MQRHDATGAVERRHRAEVDASPGRGPAADPSGHERDEQPPALVDRAGREGLGAVPIAEAGGTELSHPPAPNRWQLADAGVVVGRPSRERVDHRAAILTPRREASHRSECQSRRRLVVERTQRDLGSGERIAVRAATNGECRSDRAPVHGHAHPAPVPMQIEYRSVVNEICCGRRASKTISQRLCGAAIAPMPAPGGGV